jgi:hippurate hydrolase
MAATDEFHVTIKGLGSHAAFPQGSVDPVIISTQIVQALQSIVSRNVDPLESAVLSVTAINAGKAHNIIPQNATFLGTVRTLTPGTRELVEKRFKEVVNGFVAAHGAEAEIEYRRGYPVTYNHDAQTDFAASVAKDIAGDNKVNTEQVPVMGGEDFSFMLESRPGAFIFMGNGDSAGLHHEDYDFNDAAIPVGCSYWAKLVETAMPA